MNRRTGFAAGLGLALVLAVPAEGLAQVEVRTSVLFESYGFDSGLALPNSSTLKRLTQVTLPVAMTMQLQRRTSLTVSTAYTRAGLESESSGTATTRTVSGLTDVEGRLAVDLIPERLILFATAALPLGNSTLDTELRPLAGLLANEALSFSARNLGTGGNVGVGLAGALPAGKMAVGFAGSLTQYGGFEPIVNDPSTFKPGRELRARLGIEGPVGPRWYLRVAGIFSRRGEDEVAETVLGSPGNRYAGYVSLNHGIGRSSLTVYLLDSFRATAQIEGGSLQPRGNLIALGGQLSVPFSGATTVVPRIEFRKSDLAVTPGSDELSNVGSNLRLGADVARDLGNGLSLVLDLDGIFGTLSQGAVEGGTAAGSGLESEVSVTGFRTGIHLEVRR